MKVLLVNGSPHEKGCTYTALEEVAKTLNAEGIETEIFQIGTKPISGCRRVSKQVFRFPPEKKGSTLTLFNKDSNFIWYLTGGIK